MSTVRPITPHLQSLRVPTQLAQLPGWLIWRYEDNGAAKPRKVPYYAHGGRRLGKHGAPPDVDQLTTFAAARKAAASRGFDGVGFAPLPAFGVTVTDFDQCVGPDGVDERVNDLCAGTYAEYSPSGTGVHAISLGNFGRNPKAHATPDLFGVEVFATKGFVTVTGAPTEDCELTGFENTLGALSEPLLAEFTRRFGQRVAEDVAPASGAMGLSAEQVREALDKLPNDDLDYDSWLQVGMAVHHELGGDGFDIWDAWAAKSNKYTDREYNEARWDSFGRNDGSPVTFRTVLKLAGTHGLQLDVGQVASDDDFQVIDTPAESLVGQPVALDWLNLPENPEPIPFVIPGWMPDQVVTLLAAHGGTGKSYLSLYIALCIAMGRHPFDPRGTIERRRVMLYSAEDNLQVVHVRVAAYLRLLGVDRRALVGWLDIIDMTTCNNVLFAGSDRGPGRTTARFDWLKARCADAGTQVLIFDNASDAMDASENDRAKVRQFLAALRRLAPAVLLLAHVDAASSTAVDPTLAKGYSGSTGWHNSARSRWFMARDAATDEIVLALPKVNYAKAGSQAIIQWDDDFKVFKVVEAREGRLQIEDCRSSLLALLAQCNDEGINVGASRNAPRGAWAVLSAMDGFPRGLNRKTLLAEVDRWLNDGLVETETYVGSNRSTAYERLRVTDKGRRLIHETRDSCESAENADA